MSGKSRTSDHIDQIDEISAINRVDEIVFCSKDLPSQEIIRIMTRLIGSSVDFKIAPPESLSVIGSNSINTRATFIPSISIPSGKSQTDGIKGCLMLVWLCSFC